jgi:hypothetical protein
VRRRMALSLGRPPMFLAPCRSRSSGLPS